MLRNNNIDYILSTVLYVLWTSTLQQRSPVSEEDCQPSAQVCGYFKGSTDGELSAFVPHSSSVKVCDEGPSQESQSPTAETIKRATVSTCHGQRCGPSCEASQAQN